MSGAGGGAGGGWTQVRLQRQRLGLHGSQNQSGHVRPAQLSMAGGFRQNARVAEVGSSGCNEHHEKDGR